MASNPVPNNDSFLSINELNDPDNEIIFVQHPRDVPTEKVAQCLKKRVHTGTNNGLMFTEISDPKIYPVAFGNGDLVVSKKVDRYFVATHLE